MNRKDKKVLKEDHKRWFRQNYSISEDNMKYVKIPRDGNCAIHCIFLALLIENKINSATFLQLCTRERKKKIREYIIYLRCHVADISSKEKDEQLKENMLKKLLDVRSEEESANWFSDIEIISIASMYGINIFPSQNKKLNYMYIGPNFDREKPLFLYDYVDNNHFELYILLEKFNNLDRKLRTFLETYHLNNFEITNVEVLQYCSNINKNIKIDDKKIYISNEIKKRMKDVLKKVKSPTLNRFNKNDEVIYIKGGKNEKVKIVDVHFDNAPDIYYSLNNNRQTPEEYLRESMESSDDQKESVPTCLRKATTSSTTRRKNVKENVKEKTTSSTTRRKDGKKSKRNKFNKNDTVLYTKDGQNVKATIAEVYDDPTGIYYLISMKGKKYKQTPEEYLTESMDSSDDQKESVPTSPRKATTSSTARRKNVKENVKEKTTSSTTRRKNVNIIYLDTSDDEISQIEESKTPYEKLTKKDKEKVDRFIKDNIIKHEIELNVIYNNKSHIQNILKYYENKQNEERKEKKGKKK